MREVRFQVCACAAIAALAVLPSACSRKAETLSHTTRDGHLSPLLAKLGDFHRTISTKSEIAQRYFDQGLVLVYGFNHPEAIRSFQEAARNDANLAMAYWGEALATGPNINDAAAEPEREKAAYQASRKAVAAKSGATPAEQALIDAMAIRHSEPEGARRQERMDAYAEAMRKVRQQFPEDPDVGTLYASAVMDSMPWNYYAKDGTPKPIMVGAIAALEDVIAKNPRHPGAHHYYIHAVEASPTPDRAVPSAEKLAALVPGAGHIVHMPSHIFIRVGRYEDATKANRQAISADEDYITQCRAQGIYPAAYYPHNIHFLTASLAMQGKSREMIEASQKVGHHHADSMLNQPGFGFAHLLHAIPELSLVRFGRWGEILKLPEPHGSAFHTGMWHFARGMAFNGQGKQAEASAELAELKKIAAQPELEQLKVFDVNALSNLAQIAVNVLAGEIAAKSRNYPASIASLRKAVQLEDALLYSEPPDWPNPPRHNLGAVLLEAGRFKDAETVYREDLRRHRNNGWSLYGLAVSLEKQGRPQDAATTMAGFKQAWSQADIEITSSRF